MATVITAKKYAPGLTGFYQWFTKTYPKVAPKLNKAAVNNVVKAHINAKVAVAQRAPLLKKVGLAGLGAVTANVTVAKPATPVAAAQPWYVSAAQTALSTIKDAFVTKLEYEQQKNLINMQMQRAAQGLEPIDAAAVSPTVNVGVSPAIQSQMNNMVLIAGLGIGALLLMKAFKK